MSQQEGPGGTPGEVLSCDPLTEVKTSEDTRPPTSPFLHFSKHHVSSTGLGSAPVLPQDLHLWQLALLCQSAWVFGNRKKLQHLTRRFFWCISLYGVPTNAAQLHNVRRTNSCLLLAKNFSSHALSCACFSRAYSLLCLLQ